MILGTLISLEAFPRMLEQVFDPMNVDVYTSDSKFGEQTRTFSSARECAEYFKEQISAGSNFVGFAAHYLDTNGHIEDRRISLDPAKCESRRADCSAGRHDASF